MCSMRGGRGSGKVRLSIGLLVVEFDSFISWTV